MREGAGDRGAAVALANASLELGPRAGPPDNARIPDHAVEVEGTDAWTRTVCDQVAAGGQHGKPRSIAQDVVLTGLEFLVANALSQGERRADRDDDVAADIFGLELLVEPVR